MSVIVVLLGASLLLALCFLAAFVWSVRRGQYDDPVTPALRMLADDDSPSPRRTPPPEHEPLREPLKKDTHT